MPMLFSTFQLAHLAPQREDLVKTWGEAVIHHRRNVAGTCSELCNSAAQLDPASVPCAEHLRSIKEEVEHVQG